jgi:ABC-2 type transport system ATP-binding protein
VIWALTVPRLMNSSAPISAFALPRAIAIATPRLYDDLTVRQHLELVRISHGAHGPGPDERIVGWLDRLGLAARADFLPRGLSRCMRLKTQLTCALVRPAAVLVLDEPVVT